jgi:hypothetical protein
MYRTFKDIGLEKQEETKYEMKEMKEMKEDMDKVKSDVENLLAKIEDGKNILPNFEERLAKIENNLLNFEKRVSDVESKSYIKSTVLTLMEWKEKYWVEPYKSSFIIGASAGVTFAFLFRILL